VELLSSPAQLLCNDSSVVVMGILSFSTHCSCFTILINESCKYSFCRQSLAPLVLGVITIKQANGDRGLKDYSQFCDHFHFIIKRTFGMKSFVIYY